MKKPEQVVLLRVGIDTGSGGMLGPIFEDGTFEFIPIDADRDCLGRTYGNTKGRHGRKFAEYFPGRLKTKMKDALLHFDPEFESFTYGDPTRPKQSLKKLNPRDLLVFYAGLKGWGDCETPPGLYIIGYFVVERADSYNDLKRAGMLKPFAKNWHTMNERERTRLDKLLLVKGGRGSQLFRKAHLVGKTVLRKDGTSWQMITPKMAKVFGRFGGIGSLQRSTPRWVEKKLTARAAAFIESLQ